MARSRGGWAVAAAAAALVLQLANANTTSGNASAAAVNATAGSNTSAANPNASNASSAAVANASTTSNASSASAAGAASANTSNVTAAALDATAQSVSVLAKAASAACTSRDQVPGSCLNGSSARAEPEGVDLGPCVCDLTWQLCDANCQCDGEGRDCSSAELGVFSDEHGVPFKRERATVEVPLCFEQDTFLKLNSEMRLENSPLCVQRNNNPKTGRFFEPAVAVSNDKVRIEFARAGFGPWSDAKTFAQAYTAGQPYKVGMYIAIGRGSYANQAVQRFSRAEFLALPAPGANGHCQLGHMVKYWMPADSPPCVQGGDVQSVCAAGSVLAGDYLLKDLFVAKELPGTQAEWSEISKWKTVSVTAEVVTRSAMGEILSVKRVVAGSSVPAPSYDPVSKTCKNVLESMDLTLVMDGQGGIASVAALVRVSDAPTSAAGTGRNVYVTQKFSARFVDQQVFDAAGVSPIEQASFDKSGSPGYVDGLPLRAGLLANETSETPVIRLLRPGLTLPDMAGPDGMCKVCPTGATATTWGCSVVPAATAGYEANSALERLPVLFNQDVKLGCRLKLTKAQLDSMCTGKKLHPLLVYPEALRLAIWGDSDAGNFQEWLPNGEGQGQLADSELNPASGQAWDPRGNCSNVVDSIHLQVLTARIGNVKNPQQKIVGARITYGVANWLAPMETTEAYYTISSSVSFLQVADGGTVDVMPPIPSILPTLPDDLFYPFATGSAATVRPSLALAFACLVAACVRL